MRLPHRLALKPTLSLALASSTLFLLNLAVPTARADTQVDLSRCTGGWSIVNNVFSCSDGGAPPPPPASGAPSNCNISPNSGQVNAGTAVSINGSCGGTAATSWTWTGAGSPVTTQGNQTTFSTTVNPPQTIVGTPYNGSTAGTALIASFTPPAQGGPEACPGFTNTRLLVLDWNSPGRLLTLQAGGFGANDAVVVQFTTGPGNSPANNLPKIVGAEYVSAPSGRVATLSNRPCDFGQGLAFGAVVTGATTVTIPFSVGPNNTGYYAALAPNTTYYLNIKNTPGSSCGITGSCDMYFDLLKPGSGY